jgi:hypothetical protein
VRRTDLTGSMVARGSAWSGLNVMFFTDVSQVWPVHTPQPLSPSSNGHADASAPATSVVEGGLFAHHYNGYGPPLQCVILVVLRLKSYH